MPLCPPISKSSQGVSKSTSKTHSKIPSRTHSKNLKSTLKPSSQTTFPKPPKQTALTNHSGDFPKPQPFWANNELRCVPRARCRGDVQEASACRRCGFWRRLGSAKGVKRGGKRNAWFWFLGDLLGFPGFFHVFSM